MMPFDREAFLDVFAAYHASVGAAALALYALGLVCVGLGLQGGSPARRGVMAILAGLWAWMGLVYHFGFFSAINPAAWVFGGAFLLQAGLFAIAAVRERVGGPAPRWGRIAGLVLVAYALVLYPILGQISDHAFPRSPTFGLPCPTTILTIGVLLVLSPRPRWWLVVVPALWGVVGTSAAFALGIPEDLGLGMAALIGSIGLAAPRSFTAVFRDEVGARLRRVSTAPVLREDDLTGVPDPVRRWIRASGAIGLPRPVHFAATWRGRIRSGPDAPWMTFTAEQHNFVDEPARFFLMEARRAGLPVHVLHAYQDGAASMRVRLLGLVPVMDAHGPEATCAETVTLLNDLSVLAPGALADPAIHWEPVDDRSARAFYRAGANTISAVLHIDDAGQLVDFVSDDRFAASRDGEHFERQRWSTPLHDHRSFGPHRAAGRGEGLWHPAGGSFTYIELELLDLQIG